MSLQHGWSLCLGSLDAVLGPCTVRTALMPWTCYCWGLYRGSCMASCCSGTSYSYLF